MTRKTKLIVGVGGVLVLVIVALLVFVRYEIRKSFPETTGTITVQGLNEAVEVQRDSYGVPVITAKNDNDLMFAIGYVHAQDRLWQMDIERRAAEGRLSELFGRVTVPFDRMFRIIGLDRTARAIEGHLGSASREALQAYADGVNAFISSHRGKYPFEFDLLRYDPEPWTVTHSILLARLVAWQLNLSWWTDLTMGAIAERVGLEKAADIFPSYPPHAPVVVPGVEWRRYVGLADGYLRTAKLLAQMMGGGMQGGSNAWVIAPSRSATGGALLANDTHLQLTIPSFWFELALHAPDLNVRGMSLPGVPGVVAGRNDSIAWGLTNLMADDADFYVERLDSVTGQHYFFNGAWQPITFLHEEILVRSDSTIPLAIRLTHHGPIVTDIETDLQKARYPYVASMRWTGFEIDDPVAAFLAIDRARNWKEFSSGVKMFSVPGQNFVYGDRQGNIGYWCGVRLPIRGRQNSLLPLPGWDRSTDWKGFVPFEQLPHLLNPSEGYIASANNKIVDDAYPYHISDLWEPPSRFVRLHDVLGRKGELFSVLDFEHLQTDTYSPYAKEITPYILGAFADSTVRPPEELEVLEYLRTWNCYFSRDDIATAVFQQFYVRLLQNIYRDEMGDELFHDFVILGNFPIRVTQRLLQDNQADWFDDVSTPAVETRDEIIRKSLREALQDLRNRFGDNMKAWRWGSMHTVTLRHPFGLLRPFDRLFNIGPFPFPGGSTTLISGEYSFNDPFAVTVGPSFRQIFDMANPSEVRAVLPSGESGQVFHPHYSDQTDLWLNGGYRIARSDGKGGNWDLLRLVPAR